MALKYTVDSLDGLDDGIKSLYIEKDGKFVLDVEDNGLKTALQKEREAAKEAAAKLKEIEDEKKRIEEAALEEQGKYKELSEKYKNEKFEYSQKLNELQTNVAKKERDLKIKKLATELTTDPTEQEIVSRFANDYFEIKDGEAVLTKDVKEVVKELSRFVKNKSNVDVPSQTSPKKADMSTEEARKASLAAKIAQLQ